MGVASSGKGSIVGVVSSGMDSGGDEFRQG